MQSVFCIDNVIASSYPIVVQFTLQKWQKWCRDKKENILFLGLIDIHLLVIFWL